MRKTPAWNGSEWLLLIEVRLPPEAGRHRLSTEFADLAEHGLGLPEQERSGFLETLDGALKEQVWSDEPLPIVLLRVRVPRVKDPGSLLPAVIQENHRGESLAEQQIRRGWGYFMIESSAGESGISDHSLRIVDLYLYMEG